MRKNFPSYEEAQKICALNDIKKSGQYEENCVKLGLPSDPHRVYAGRWISFNAFMHVDPILLVSKTAVERARDYLLAHGPTNISHLCESLSLTEEESQALRSYVTNTKFPFVLSGRILSLSISGVMLLTLNEVRQIIKDRGITAWEQYKSIRLSYGHLPLPSYQNFGKKWAEIVGKRTRPYSRDLMTREECLARLQQVWPKISEAMPHLTVKALVRHVKNKKERSRLFSSEFLTNRFPKRFDLKYGYLTDDEVSFITTGQKSSSEQATGLLDTQIER